MDPYYLTYKAESLGYKSEVILAGRRINDDMGARIAKKLVQQLIQLDKAVAHTKVLVMGATFKENVSDIRNSKVVDVIKALNDFSVQVEVTDPYADGEEFHHEYGIDLLAKPGKDYDAVIMAVNHDKYAHHDEAYFKSLMKPDGILVDIKGDKRNQIKELRYWSL